ncbi:amino acid permease [Pelomyxa schiedti]|nr:amino acid permease [Pelomyxa schiedti]
MGDEHHEASEAPPASSTAAVVVQGRGCWGAYSLGALLRVKDVSHCEPDTIEADLGDVEMVAAPSPSSSSSVPEGPPATGTGTGGGTPSDGSGAMVVEGPAPPERAQGEAAGAEGVVVTGEAGKRSLKRRLGIWDVIVCGLGATVGAGVYSLVGIAAQEAGPAIVVSFLVGGIAGLFTAFVYAEFAARVPVAGSAYTYAYATVVARAFGDYFIQLLLSFDVHVPSWINSWSALSFNCSPIAAVLIMLCTIILTTGIRYTAIFNAVVTCINVTVLLFVIITGSIHVDPSNWKCVDNTFFPYGVNSVISAAGQLFFAYIGFDAVTTIAEEVKKPSYLPIGVLSTLGISCSLYMGISLVVTGMAPFTALNGNASVAQAFDVVGLPWASKIVSAGALFGSFASAFTALLGQSRIFFRISRDGLLIPAFGSVSKLTRAPVIGIILTGLMTASVAFFASLDLLSKTISIGTLLAFCVVNAGVLLTRYHHQKPWITYCLILWFSVAFFTGCISLHFNAPLWVYIPLLVISIPPVFLLWWFVPKFTPASAFLCPLMPFTPFMGLGVNLFLISGLDGGAWLRLVVWTAVGLVIYFTYGIRYSKLRKPLEIPSLRGFFCCSPQYEKMTE